MRSIELNCYCPIQQCAGSCSTTCTFICHLHASRLLKDPLFSRSASNLSASPFFFFSSFFLSFLEGDAFHWVSSKVSCYVSQTGGIMMPRVPLYSNCSLSISTRLSCFLSPRRNVSNAKKYDPSVSRTPSFYL